MAVEYQGRLATIMANDAGDLIILSQTYPGRLLAEEVPTFLQWLTGRFGSPRLVAETASVSTANHGHTY